MAGFSIEDRIAVQDAVCRVGVCVDNQELSRLPDLFSPDATFNYKSWGPTFNDTPAAEFLPTIMQFIPGFDSSTHHTTNFDIRIDGDTATSRSVVTATHRVDEKIWIVGGIYRHELKRINGEWKISHMAYRTGWEIGEQLVDLARAKAKLNARPGSQP